MNLRDIREKTAKKGRIHRGQARRRSSFILALSCLALAQRYTRERHFRDSGVEHRYSVSNGESHLDVIEQNGVKKRISRRVQYEQRGKGVVEGKVIVERSKLVGAPFQ